MIVRKQEIFKNYTFVFIKMNGEDLQHCVSHTSHSGWARRHAMLDPNLSNYGSILSKIQMVERINESKKIDFLPWSILYWIVHLINLSCLSGCNTRRLNWCLTIGSLHWFVLFRIWSANFWSVLSCLQLRKDDLMEATKKSILLVMLEIALIRSSATLFPSSKFW